MEILGRLWQLIAKRGAVDDGAKTIPIYFVFFFVINYTMGTGFLGIPFSFYHAGIITGLLTNLAVGLLSYVGAIWLIESMARAQALETWEKETKSNSSKTENKPLLPKFEIRLDRKFEPSELCKIFLGFYGEYSFVAMLAVHVILICWVSATVAGSALASNISYNFGSLERCRDSEFHHEVIPGDGCRDSYRFSVFLYALIVLPLCFLELSEQKYIQILLGCLRISAIVCIVTYCFIKLVGSDDYPSNYDVHCNDTNITIEYNNSNCDPNEVLGDYDYWHEISRFGLKGWLTAIPVFVYAQVMHASISKLTHPLKQKQYLKYLLMCVFATSTTVYSSIGVVVALWFKEETEETCTLNFVYSAHHASSDALRAMSYFLLLFPFLDVVSSYPLAVLVMKDNLFMAITGRDSVTGVMPDEDPRLKKKKQVLRLVLSLCVAVLPLTGSFFVANLVDITRYAGLIGFAKCFFYPAILQLKSQYDCNKIFFEAMQSDARKPVDVSINDETVPLISDKTEEFPQVAYLQWNNPTYTTPYQTIFSHPIMVVVLSLFSIVAFGLAVASLPVRVHKND